MTVEYVLGSMEKETIDRLTVAGLAIFVILSIIYLCWDHITELKVSLNPPSADIALPAFTIPDLSLDWFHSMDPASKLVFTFVMFLLLSTLVGGTLVYLRHRKSSARR
jgi:hypothetical protein